MLTISADDSPPLDEPPKPVKPGNPDWPYVPVR